MPTMEEWVLMDSSTPRKLRKRLQDADLVVTEATTDDYRKAGKGCESDWDCSKDVTRDYQPCHPET